MKKENIHLSAGVILFVLLFAAIAHNLLSHSLGDYDFWWHISSGRYIVETGALPEADPFSYTSSMKENENLFPEMEELLLKQYWLGQVIFYLVYQNTGAAGMIILRSVLLIMTLLIVLWQLKRWDTDHYISYIFVFLLYLVLAKFIGERPVLFTILFTPLVFVMLEDFKDRDGKLLFLLPPLMLFWANVHGGFIIGNIMIMVYMVTEGLKILLKKTEYGRRKTVFFYSAVILALAASYINPMGWDAFIFATSQKYAMIRKGVYEYQSPLFFYINKIRPINAGFLILIFLFPLVLIIRNRKIDLTHAVLLSGLFVMAVKSSRFIAFYSSVASIILGRETYIILKDLFGNRISGKSQKLMINVFNAAALLSITVFFIAFGNLKGFNFDISRYRSVPVGAVDFIEKNRIPGNLFNSPGYGGYITWRLYPWKKTFIDTRWLNSQVPTEYEWIIHALESIKNSELPEGKQPLWKRLLDHYNIHLIMLRPTDAYGSAPDLLLELTEDRDWTLIYSDYVGVVFIRNVPRHKGIIKKFEQPKENVYNIIISKSAHKALHGKNPNYLVTLGRTFYRMGRLEDALNAYRYASKRLPESLMIKEKVDELEAELKQKNRNENN